MTTATVPSAPALTGSPGPGGIADGITLTLAELFCRAPVDALRIDVR